MVNASVGESDMWCGMSAESGKLESSNTWFPPFAVFPSTTAQTNIAVITVKKITLACSMS